MSAIWRGANGRRHEIDSHDDPVIPAQRSPDLLPNLHLATRCAYVCDGGAARPGLDAELGPRLSDNQ